jgi:hypothetical protein
MALTVANMTAVDVPGDGNCMFHAVAAAAPDMTAAQLRAAAVQYMRDKLDVPLFPDNQDTATFRQWIQWAGHPQAEAYLAALARNGTWGQSLDLAALCHVLQRPIGVYSPDSGTGNKQCRLIADFQPTTPQARANPPAYVLYVGRSHYMALQRMD